MAEALEKGRSAANSRGKRFLSPKERRSFLNNDLTKKYLPPGSKYSKEASGLPARGERRAGVFYLKINSS